MTTESITEGQGKQLKRFAEDAIDHAIRDGILNKGNVQAIIERGNEFQGYIFTGIREITARSRRLSDRTVDSVFGYVSGYKPGEVKSVKAQINTLRQLVPQIRDSADQKIFSQPVPKGAEGWFAIPPWNRIAKTYSEATKKLFELFRSQLNGNFYNWLEEVLDEKHLRQHERTARALEALASQQMGYNFLVVAAQFGAAHQGRSVNEAHMVFTTNEFGLGVFEVGCMLLTHPERLRDSNDIWIDCAGTENASRLITSKFNLVPYYYYGGGKTGGQVKVDAYYFDTPYPYHGSATGFLPNALTHK